MNNSAPSCKIIFTPVGPWFLLHPLELEIPGGLNRDRFDRFDYGKDFAGCSPRGICLSVKGSAGPARIGPYRIFEKVPSGWVTLPLRIPGLLLRTNEPRLGFFGIRKGTGWANCINDIAIHREDLAEIVEIHALSDKKSDQTDEATDELLPDAARLPPPPRRLSKQLYRQSEPPGIPIEELSIEIVKLLARYAAQLKLIFFDGQYHIRIPSTLILSREQWHLLSRHVFTGKAFGCVDETVPFTCHLSGFPPRYGFGRTPGAINFPGCSLEEVKMRWGITAKRPCAYDGSGLLFRALCVADASKLSQLYPSAKLLGGRMLRVFDESGFLQSRYGCEELPRRGPDLRKLSSYDLIQAVDAGVVPQGGELIVNGALERVFLAPDLVRLEALKAPLEFRQNTFDQLPGLLCPQPLIESCLLSSTKAGRTYRLPADLNKYTVRTLDPESGDTVDLVGTYYRIADLASLPRRDLRSERAERKARLERLVAAYGSDLPQDYEKYTDDQLKTYYEIKDMLARGEIVSIHDHPALPSHYRGDRFFEWIRKTKPELVVTCPVTTIYYLNARVVLDELADLPGFWEAVVGVTGAHTAWLRTLVLSPKVRAAALAEAL